MIFNMNFELRNELANFGTKFGIFWQKLCEIDCKTAFLQGELNEEIYMKHAAQRHSEIPNGDWLFDICDNCHSA